MAGTSRPQADRLSAATERACGELRCVASFLRGAIEQLPTDENFVVLRSWFELCERRLLAVTDALAVEIIDPDERAIAAYEQLGRRWLSPLVAGSIAVSVLTGLSAGFLEAAGQDLWDGAKAVAVRSYEALENLGFETDVEFTLSPPAEQDRIAHEVEDARDRAWVKAYVQRAGE